MSNRRKKCLITSLIVFVMLILPALSVINCLDSPQVSYFIYSISHIDHGYTASSGCHFNGELLADLVTLVLVFLQISSLYFYLPLIGYLGVLALLVWAVCRKS